MEHRHFNRYGGDPFWLTAKFSGKCARKSCGRVIPAGGRAFYYPRTKALYCDSPGCGQAESSSFESAAADEFFYNQQF